MPRRRIKGRLVAPQVPDEGIVMIPFGYRFVSGAPVLLKGDNVESIADTGDGKQTITLRDKPNYVFYGEAFPSITADNVDLYAQVDWTDATVGGTFVVKTKTGATNTDPPDGTFIGGYLFCKKTTRKAR